MNDLHPIPVTNRDANDNYIDRIYGGINGQIRLVQSDGSQYTGQITKKTITLKDTQGVNFRSYVYVTEDGRWFNRGGLPIDEPNTLSGDDD